MTGNNMGYQSEEGGVEKGAIGGGGGSHQYSSQDSLPDSPYSSQSLDVQPLSEQGMNFIRRGMSFSYPSRRLLLTVVNLNLY